MSLSGKKVAVTGATGFLGGALARRLVANGVQVTALVRSLDKAASLEKLGITLVQGDLTTPDSVRRAVAGSEIVFHVAAGMNGGYEEMYPATVTGTQNVVDAAAVEGIKRIVHVSSIAVYSLSYRGMITEDKPIIPGAYPYANTKALAEQIVLYSPIEYSIIRPAMIYGPGASLWTAGMFRLASMRPTPFVGDGSGSSHPIFVDDVVDMMYLLGEHPGAANQIFNCAPDPAPTWRAYLGAYQQLVQNDSWFALPVPLMAGIAAILMMFSPRKSFMRDMTESVGWLTSRNAYSMAKARDLLGWSPRTTLEQGIAQCAMWLRESGQLA
jgi:nucleoside-diphosphate-sugar epimerase